MYPVFAAVRALKDQLQIAVIGVKFIVQHIADDMAVDAYQPVAGMGTALQRTARIKGTDDVLHTCLTKKQRRKGSALLL